MLRVLFAKMNGVAGGTSQAVNQVHGNNNNSSRHRTQEPMPMPVSLCFVYLLSHFMDPFLSAIIKLAINIIRFFCLFIFCYYRCFCRRVLVCPLQLGQPNTKSTLKSTGKYYCIFCLGLFVGLLLCVDYMLFISFLL